MAAVRNSDIKTCSSKGLVNEVHVTVKADAVGTGDDVDGSGQTLILWFVVLKESLLIMHDGLLAHDFFCEFF